jgi:hypothetical protein
VKWLSPNRSLDHGSWGLGRKSGALLRSVASLAEVAVIGARGRPVALVGERRGRQGLFAKLGRVLTRGGAVFQERRTCVGGPPVGVSRTLGRVTRATEHRAVADVERRTASGERDDVINGQVAGGMGVALVARAPAAALATPCSEHSRAETLPGPRAVEGVVPAPVGLPSVLEAAATRAAGDDTTDRAQLHPRIVDGVAGAVYTLAVLRLRGQPSECTGRPGGHISRCQLPPGRYDGPMQRRRIGVCVSPVGGRL